MDILDIKEFIKDSLDYLITFLVIFLIVIYVFGFSRVVGDSMANTLYNGDIVLTSNSHYKLFDIKRGDVISFYTEEVVLIKRVIGLPGDLVKIEKGVIYINNEKLSDDSFISDTNYTETFLRVPDGYVFVLGDNMPNSVDSRKLGFIPKDNVESKVMFRFFPFNKFDKV